jgi:fimbrial isopeptide formation D2 family protein/uncharacterized repeat protein (TIGR01451 family)
MKIQRLFKKFLPFFVGTFFIFYGSPVWADPILDVNVSSNVVLLGGQARYTVTVENTDTSDKGYDLSFSHVFSSDRDEPEGNATFVSASDSVGTLPPTTVVTDPVTGDTTIEFINIKDLAANETYSFTLTVDLSGDTTWEAMDHVIHDVAATVNTLPNGAGTDVTDTEQDTSDVLPIALMRKVADQSTGVEQATGTIDRVYGYTIEVQNNYVNDTDDVVVTDTLPDGVEFLGITSGHTCSDSREDDTGITTIVCDLGTMTPSGGDNNHVIEYDAGIRYDFYGTDNGGTNRDHDDFDGDPALGTPISNKTQFTNHVDLDAEYQSQTLPTQSKESSVTAAYATVSKSGHISRGGNGDVINYTLTYTTSEYYDILDDDTDDNNSSITLHDLLPDGQTYNDDASPTESSFTTNGDGTTDIYWNSSVLDALDNSDSFNVTFSATVDETWNDSTPIVGADSMSNSVDSHGEWDDQVDTSRANGMTDSSASANFFMSTPQITKEVEDPDNPGSWIESVDATVGDTLTFRVRFNTNDGATPDLVNVNLGDIVVTDWLPPGLTYNDDAVMTYSDNGDFTGSNFDDDPSAVTVGGLDGLEWELGDVEKGGWWQAVFTVNVIDDTCVMEGKTANNLWKMTGLNTNGEAYSDRDNVEISYHEPYLVLDKTVSNSPSPLEPGDSVEYTVTIENTGSVPAEDVSFVDTVATYMDDATPTVTSIDLNGSALTQGTDYVAPAWDGGSRQFTIDFNDGGVETNIDSGEVLTVVYTTTVDVDAGAGWWFNNVATVAYNTQDDGSGRQTDGTSNTSDNNTDNAGIGLASAMISKSASVGPYSIGDTITYSLDVTVPQGQIVYWPEIQDTFDMDGVSYVPSSAALSLVSGTPVTAASFDASTNPDPVIDTGGSDNTALQWLLNNPVDNRGQATNYVFRLTYDVVYTGLEDNGTDWEFFVPTSGDQVDNTANVRSANYPAASRTTNRSSNSNTVSVDIDQPLLTTTKSITSSGPYTAGSTIDYQVAIENTGDAVAYDVTWIDDLPNVMGNAVLTSVTHSVGGPLTSGVNFSENFTSDPITIDFDGGTADTHLPPGATITIVYSAMTNNDIGAGASVINTVDTDWSTHDGTVTGERVYDDSSAESGYTADTDTAEATISAATFDKTITSPASGQATIGEIVTYRVRATVPAETVLYSPTIQDVIKTDGMEFIGSVTVTDVSGSPETAAAISAMPTVNTSSPTPGTTIDFVFDSDIDNANSASPTGDDPYVFDVEYQMRVTGLDDSSAWIWDPSVTGHTADNTATLEWSDGSTNQSQNDNASLDIVQPYLEVMKNFDTENVAGGDTVTATVVITNGGNGTAYEFDADADFIDVMDEGFTNPVITSLTHSVNGLLSSPVDYSFTANSNGFSLEYENAQTDLAPGETLTLVYTVDIDPLVGAGADIANDADVDYSSMSGSQADERVYDDTDPLEGDADTDSDNVTTAAAMIVKTTTLGAGEATIGEEFEYVITVSIPENTTVYNSIITDTAPDGITITGVDSTPVIGSLSYSELPDGTTPVTWTAGDVANDPIDELVLTIHARVDEAFVSTTPLDGLPSGIDSDPQDTLTNDAECQWDDADTGGSTLTRDADVTVTVIEPHPTITKDVNSNTAGIGDTMTYTVEIANDGTSTLYDIDWSDSVPVHLFDAGVSPTLTSVTHSIHGVLNEGVGYASSFASNPITIDFDMSPETTLAPGESITIIYDAYVENAVLVGDILTNDAVFNGASQPESNPNGRSYSDSDQESVTIAATSIGDKVWHDTDKDGTQDPGELGFEHVRVELRDAAGDPLDDPLNPGTPYVVNTDSDGEYLFANLSAGDYRIYFALPVGYAFSPQDQGGDDAVDSDANVSTGMTSTLSLAHDEHITDVDAGIVAATIRGLTWLDINGDGVQDGGDTWYPGITVRLLDSAGDPVDDPLNPGTPYVVTTNVAGNYLFENLLAGDYRVQFDEPSGYVFSPQDQGGNDAADSDASSTGRTAVISLIAGDDNTDTDAGVYEPVEIGDRVWNDSNADGVQDPGENGVAGATVQLLDSSGTPVDDPNNPGTAYEIITAADGGYTFVDLPPGDYQIGVVPPVGYIFTPQDQGGNDTVDSDMDTTTGRSSVFTTVSGTNDTSVDAGLYRLASIGDTVWRDDERDGIQASWEEGLAGVTVELLDGGGISVDDPLSPGTPYVVTTGADGRYLFENLTPGTYSIRFTPPADHEAAPKDQGSDDALDSDINETTYTTDPFSVISGEDNTVTDAGIYALYANVFDPPHANKTVGETGENEMEWTMVWINDGNMAAINTQVLDAVPDGTTYVSGSLSCDARGASTTDVCVYDVVEDRVRWEGDIAPDPGGTSEEDSLNEVVIVYRTTVAPEIDEVENQAEAYWDANGDGDFVDDIGRGQESVKSDDPTTSENADPTVWTRAREAEGNSSIGNYIWHDRNGDGKQDPDEPGLENIRVKLIWAGPDDEFGNSDDHVWRTDTNHNGHYLFENLPEGKYKVKVKEEDIRGWVQTYDPTGAMNNRASVKLEENDHHTKADFGYNTSETLLARTGDNMVAWLAGSLLGIISMGTVWRFTRE